MRLIVSSTKMESNNYDICGAERYYKKILFCGTMSGLEPGSKALEHLTVPVIN